MKGVIGVLSGLAMFALWMLPVMVAVPISSPKGFLGVAIAAFIGGWFGRGTAAGDTP